MLKRASSDKFRGMNLLLMMFMFFSTANFSLWCYQLLIQDNHYLIYCNHGTDPLGFLTAERHDYIQYFFNFFHLVIIIRSNPSSHSKLDVLDLIRPLAISPNKKTPMLYHTKQMFIETLM